MKAIVIRKPILHRCRRNSPSNLPPPSFSVLRTDVVTSVDEEEDLYGRLKSLQRQLEFINIQEEYVKDEHKNLKRELLRAQEEVKRIQSVPLVIGQFMEMVDQNNGIIGSTTGSNYYVRILSTINRELHKSSASVALHRHSNALVDVLPPEADSSISLLSQSKKPDVNYNASESYFSFVCLLFFSLNYAFFVRFPWNLGEAGGTSWQKWQQILILVFAGILLLWRSSNITFCGGTQISVATKGTSILWTV
ncbi:hypothetical protein KSP40_PGU006870 [Platanthera guangdongensis]|uniref:Proteasomal ATPase second OB domain-containing protein n=1 Tax=Platanthera guangdongensis TaxID=2320717 RepID=A0ABR2LDB8_9ASPA